MEVYIEPELDNNILDVISSFFSDLADFVHVEGITAPLEHIFKIIQIIAHFVYGAMRTVVESIASIVEMLVGIFFEGKLGEIIDSFLEMIRDPKLIGLIIQEKIDEFIQKPFLEKIEMLGGLFVDIGLLVVGGVAVVKGLANFLTKGVGLIKKLVVTGKMGGKTVNISLAGAATAAVTLTRSGMVKLKDLASSVRSIASADLPSIIRNLPLTVKQQSWLILQRVRWDLDEFIRTGHTIERHGPGVADDALRARVVDTDWLQAATKFSSEAVMKSTLSELLSKKGGAIMQRLFIDGQVDDRLTVIYKSNKSLGSGYFKSITGEIMYISDLRNATAVFDKVDDTLKLVTFHPSN